MDGFLFWTLSSGCTNKSLFTLHILQHDAFDIHLPIRINRIVNRGFSLKAYSGDTVFLIAHEPYIDSY